MVDLTETAAVALVCPLCHTLGDWVRAHQEGVSPALCPHGGGADPEALKDNEEG